MKKTVYFLILFVLSCTSNNVNNKDIPAINLDDIPIEEPMPYSVLFKEPRTIILEENDDVIIGEIQSIQIYNNHIFVLDARVAKKLFVFDMDGKFIRQIGSLGIGPGEYIDVNAFCVDDNKVYLSDHQSHNVHVYNYENGDHLNSIKLNNTCLDITVLNNKLYTAGRCGEKEDNLLLEINLKNGKQKEYVSAEEYNLGWTGLYENRFFYGKTTETQKFTQLFANTIFSIDDSGVQPFLRIYTKDWVTKENILDKEYDSPSKKKVCRISNYMEYKDNIYFTYYKGGQSFPIFYNTTTQKTTCPEYLYDDLANNTKLRSSIFHFYNHKAIYLSRRTNRKEYFSETMDKYKKIMELDEERYIVLEYEFK